MPTEGRTAFDQIDEEISEDIGGFAEVEDHDPFAPKLLPAVVKTLVKRGTIMVKSDVELEGIGIGPEGSYVILSGDVYQRGEVKNGILVTKIREKEVDIIINGISQTLRMLPPNMVAYLEAQKTQRQERLEQNQ